MHKTFTDCKEMEASTSAELFHFLLSYQVAQNTCWSCGVNCQFKQELQNHLHETSSFKESPLPWENDMYLKPFMQEDTLLYSFGEDDLGGDESVRSVDEKEIVRNLSSFEKIYIDYENDMEPLASELSTSLENGMDGDASVSVINLNVSLLGDGAANGCGAKAGLSYDPKSKDGPSQISSPEVVENQKLIVNKSYFGSYGSFGIHREMISDKVSVFNFWLIDNCVY